VAIDRILAGNEVVGVVLAIIIVLIARANLPFLRDVFSDGEAPWRGLARCATLALGLTLAWVSVFDHWRQLLDEPMRQLGQFPSEKIVLDPTPAPLRTVSLVLLAFVVLGFAPLVARHVGGYPIQVVGAIGCLLLCLPLYTLRVRFDFGLALGFDADPRNPIDLAGYALYLLITWGFLTGVLLLLVTGITFLVALPVTLLLDLTGRRHPRITHEADSFFGSLADRATRRDGPGGQAIDRPEPPPP